MLISFLSFLAYGYFFADIKKIVVNEPQTSLQEVIIQEESLSKEEKLAQFKRRMNFRSILRK
jgi:hypothetical protein